MESAEEFGINNGYTQWQQQELARLVAKRDAALLHEAAERVIELRRKRYSRTEKEMDDAYTAAIIGTAEKE